MQSPTETLISPDTQQSQLNNYALLIVATVESLMDNNEQVNDHPYAADSDLMISERIQLTSSCSSDAKIPLHVCASQQSMQTPSGTIKRWSLKFDCSYTDLFSATAKDKMRAITFTVCSDVTKRDLKRVSIEAANITPIVIDLQSSANHQKRIQILKMCKEIIIPLLVELEIVRHRASVLAATQKSFQKD